MCFDELIYFIHIIKIVFAHIILWMFFFYVPSSTVVFIFLTPNTGDLWTPSPHSIHLAKSFINFISLFGKPNVSFVDFL